MRHMTSGSWLTKGSALFVVVAVGLFVLSCGGSNPSGPSKTATANQASASSQTNAAAGPPVPFANGGSTANASGDGVNCAGGADNASQVSGSGNLGVSSSSNTTCGGGNGGTHPTPVNCAGTSSTTGQVLGSGNVNSSSSANVTCGAI